MPAHLALPLADAPYADLATNAWSAVVRGFDGAVFLTPQHNWGYPAGLMLMLDALYHEWAGKPTLVVAYGNRGGGAAAPGARGAAFARLRAVGGAAI
ncbi:hypothetical protein B0H10DRAFT_2013358 [Mycena sp. CBHHK59/15]|nr:hypothetical protein B0H10DRAFT_2013358 [Mycena sp. CBHHK59/15]